MNDQNQTPYKFDRAREKEDITEGITSRYIGVRLSYSKLEIDRCMD